MSQAIGGVGPGVSVASRPAARRSRVRWESWELLSGVALGAVILVAVLLYVWQHISVVRLGYAIERLRVQQAVLIQEDKMLKLERGQLRSLRRVEEVARRRLGMVTPKPGQVVLVPETTVQ